MLYSGDTGAHDGSGVPRTEPNRDRYPDTKDGDEDFRYDWNEWAGQYPALAERSRRLQEEI